MKKISVSLSGHQTSISLEQEFLSVLKQIATERGTSVAKLIADIDEQCSVKTNLSSAIRVWILNQILNK